MQGAIVDYSTCKDAREKFRQKPEEFLNNNDSYNFFKKTGEHIITGPTMTNVMDIMISLIDQFISLTNRLNYQNWQIK